MEMPILGPLTTGDWGYRVEFAYAWPLDLNKQLYFINIAEK